MLGGLAFLLDGHMCCGVLRDDLVLRLGDAALKRWVGEAAKFARTLLAK